MSAEILVTGTCQCGRVKYTSTSLPRDLSNCYCLCCRRLSGGPFQTSGEFPTESVTFTTGTSSMRQTSYSEIADRQHCAECGSQISMQYKCEPEIIYLTVGTFENVKGELPPVGRHIFVGTGKVGGYYEIPRDGVVRYESHSDGFEKRIAEWKEKNLGEGRG
ncbi:Mss4-like protein [Glarea lozoyensis ATCC 20868]|uniref:Mss4-like protein n=1 Tax=Glarea lozoyensis (strain ATCC 20868 / MF5171) TaxID=1116229 RepID=S3CQD7_GLAL2|nr:Mss4-like protein [Glarea lozoyensis ATCC 20868]EPE27314.1 Mss4-like protein [Glarea lozoyensis ATCC 20868]